ncbi:MAG: hypothetical protein KA146_05650 [Leptospiraceae bacterium]|nr:hypothetical protein [Leptospiraceae bacterium]
MTNIYSQRLLLIILISFYSACNAKFFYKEPSQKLESIPASIDKKKIALVGFYDYHTDQVGSGKIRRYVSRIDYDTRILGDLIKIGTPIEEIKENGLVDSIPSGNISSLMYNHSQLTGSEGIGTLNPLFKKENGNFVLRKRDVDYYIIGHFGPRTSINKRNIAFLGLIQKLTFLASLPTLLTLPVWHDYYSYNYIRVYDRNLNFLFEYSKEKYTNGIMAWWVTPNDMDSTSIRKGENINSQQITTYARTKIYEPDLEEFTISFLDWIQKNHK